MPCQSAPKGQPPMNFAAGPFETLDECRKKVRENEGCPCCSPPNVSDDSGDCGAGKCCRAEKCVEAAVGLCVAYGFLPGSPEPIPAQCGDRLEGGSINSCSVTTRCQCISNFDCDGVIAYEGCNPGPCDPTIGVKFFPGVLDPSEISITPCPFPGCNGTCP